MSEFDRQIVINADSRSPIVVRQSEFKGRRGIDVRKYYYDLEMELKPTQKGVWISVELWPEVLAAVQQLLPPDVEPVSPSGGNDVGTQGNTET